MCRSIYSDIAGFDISYDEYIDLCGQAWEDEDFKYFFVDISKKIEERKLFICYESKKNSFWLHTRNKSFSDIITYDLLC